MIITKDTKITAENLNAWISAFQHQEDQQPRLIKLGKYYDGTSDIIKQGAASGRPNYSIHVNLATFITNVQTGYFMGKPVDYDFKEEEKKQENPLKQPLMQIDSNNFAEEENYSLASDMSCYGVAYEVVMIDGDDSNKTDIMQRLRFSKLDAENTFFVVDDSILQHPVCAIYMYSVKNKNKVEEWRGYVYTAEEIIEFSMQGSQAVIGDRYDHQFGEIPVIEYKNNCDRKGDYEAVTEQLDALSLTISNETDDLQSIANAILGIYGATGTDDEVINKINQSKVAKLPVGSKMEFIVKNVNIDAVKHQIDQNLSLIYQITQTPDLTDDSFGGTQTGVAMRYKLWGIEQCRITKERYFRRSLFQRLRLIFNILSLSQGKSIYDISQNIDFIFYKNLPEDDADVIDLVSRLQGIVSTRTLLKQIPFIEDVDAELKEVDAENQKKSEQEAEAFASYKDEE